MIDQNIALAALAAFVTILVLRRFFRPRQPTDYEKQLHKVLHHPEYKVRGKFE